MQHWQSPECRHLAIYVRPATFAHTAVLPRGASSGVIRPVTLLLLSCSVWAWACFLASIKLSCRWAATIVLLCRLSCRLDVSTVSIAAATWGDGAGGAELGRFIFYARAIRGCPPPWAGHWATQRRRSPPAAARCGARLGGVGQCRAAAGWGHHAPPATPAAVASPAIGPATSRPAQQHHLSACVIMQWHPADRGAAAAAGGRPPAGHEGSIAIIV